MKRYKTGLIITAIAAMSMCLCGCGKDKSDTTEKVEVTTGESEFMDTTEATTEPEHEGVYNDLTGEWVTDRTEEYGRPLSVMINNIQDAIPQSDISKADIIYEFKCPALCQSGCKL
ncbi:MAG: DUF3048 domain-containing protein, partial [Coprococcus sp.]